MGEKKITNADIEAATGKPRVLCIGRGLRLQTTPKKNGGLAKSFLFRYSINGQSKTLEGRP
jgi:hypothetical protein